MFFILFQGFEENPFEIRITLLGISSIISTGGNNTSSITSGCDNISETGVCIKKRVEPSIIFALTS